MSCIKLNSNFKLQKDDKRNIITTRSHFDLKKSNKNLLFYFYCNDWNGCQYKIKKQKTPSGLGVVQNYLKVALSDSLMN